MTRGVTLGVDWIILDLKFWMYSMLSAVGG